MKRTLFTLLLIGAMVIGMGSLSFAQGYGFGHGPGYGHMYNQELSEEELEVLHQERMDYMKDAAEKYLEDGKITQEQYDNWLERIEEMEAYHEENGFTPGFGKGFGRGHGYGGCFNNTINDDN